MGACGSNTKAKHRMKRKYNQTQVEEKNIRKEGHILSERNSKIASLSLVQSDIRTSHVRKEPYKDTKQISKQKIDKEILKLEPEEVSDDYIQENFERFRVVEYSKL